MTGTHEDYFERESRCLFSTYLHTVVGWTDFQFIRRDRCQRPDYILKTRDQEVGIEVTSVWNQHELARGTVVGSAAINPAANHILRDAEAKLRSRGLLTRSFWVCFYCLQGIKDRKDEYVETIVDEIESESTNQGQHNAEQRKESRLVDVYERSTGSVGLHLGSIHLGSIGDSAIPDLLWGEIRRALNKKACKYSEFPEANRPVMLLYDAMHWSGVEFYQSPPDRFELPDFFKDVFVIRRDLVIPIMTSRIRPGYKSGEP